MAGGGYFFWRLVCNGGERIQIRLAIGGPAIPHASEHHVLAGLRIESARQDSPASLRAPTRAFRMRVGDVLEKLPTTSTPWRTPNSPSRIPPGYPAAHCKDRHIAYRRMLASHSADSDSASV
jgi:hypothetical protein